MATAQNIIKNFMSELNDTSSQGNDALNEAVKAVSNFESWEKLKSTMISDRAAYGKDWQGFLEECCGIILDNDDTGAISGSDAGGGSTKTAESVVPESGSWSYPSGTSFSIQGLTVTVPAKSSLNEKEEFIVGALYSWWIDSALNMISDSYGLSFTDSGATVNEIDVKFYDSTDGKMAYVEYTSEQKNTVLHLRINMNYYGNIDTSNENGSAFGLISYLDRTIAHEMVHAVMAANIDYFSKLPKIFKEGSAELIHGIDDKRKSNIKSVSASSSALSSGLKNNGVDGYASGYILLRYLAKQAAEGRDPAVAIKEVDETDSTATSSTSTTSTSTGSTSTKTSTGSSGSTSTKTSSGSSSSSTNTQEPSAKFSGNTLIVKGNFRKDIWLGGTASTDNPYASENATTINASQMTSSIILAGNNNDNLITSGSGGASLWGGAGGNDTLSGGSGKDTFFYAFGGGNDVIKNFSGGNDVLILSGGGLNSMTRKSGVIDLEMSDGGNLKVNLGSDENAVINYSTELGNSNTTKIKVGNTSSDNNFTYSQEISNYYGGNKENTLTVSEGAEIWLSENKYSNITEINASSSSSKNILVGDESSNKIISGSGSSSLWGGSGGDDVLQGGSGENTFWYGKNEGNDTVKNSKSADVLNLYNVQLSDIASFEKVTNGFKFEIASGSLTVNGSKMPTVKLGDGSTWTYDSKAENFSKS